MLFCLLREHAIPASREEDRLKFSKTIRTTKSISRGDLPMMEWALQLHHLTSLQAVQEIKSAR